jgi:hypothetical protein
MLFIRYRQVTTVGETERQDNCAVTLLFEIVDSQAFTQFHIRFELDAQCGDSVDIFLDGLGRKTVRGNAPADGAAEIIRSFEYKSSDLSNTVTS